MSHYSTSSRGQQIAVNSSLKDVQIVNPARAAEIRAARRALATWEYYEKFGFISVDEYIQAGMPTTNPVTGKPLGDCHISRRKGENPRCLPEIGTGVLSCFPNDLEVKKHGGKRAGGGLRGVIVGWSDGSRGRMMKALNRVRWPDGKCYFLSLTFPDKFPDPKESKRQLQALLKRIERRYPALAYLWRQELKRRKSGTNEGKIASHFHLFAWGVTDGLTDFWSWLRDAWTEIAGQSDPVNHHEHGAHVREVNDRKQACNYVAKYMEKSDDGAQTEAGRIWGMSSNLDVSPLWVIRLTAAELAFLRKLVLAWAWAECQAVPSLIRFAGRLELFTGWMGWHMYGMEETVARSMLERVLAETGGNNRVEMVMEVTA